MRQSTRSRLAGLALAAAGIAAAAPAAADAIAALSSEFDSPAALAAWREHQVPGFSPKWRPPRIENGALVLEPFSSGWFEDMQAGHLYRPVDGNFIVTARVRVEGTRAPLPQTLFSLAGLLVREPVEDLAADKWEAGRENWLFFALGSAAPAGSAQFEVKTTTRSLSTLKIHDASAAYPGDEPRWVELRIARQGELFSLLHRVDGEREFTLLDQFIRPDLPERLNVGLTAYADWGSAAPVYPDFERYNTAPAPRNADLVARVDRIVFRRPVVERFPLATLDPAVSFLPEVSERRYRDLVLE
jgi:hypothetical protein